MTAAVQIDELSFSHASGGATGVGTYLGLH